MANSVLECGSVLPPNLKKMTQLSTSLEQYRFHLQEKIQYFQSVLNNFAHPPLDIFTSPHQHYRMRAEFQIWHHQDEIEHCMFDPTTKARIVVQDFPVGSVLMNQLMVLTSAYLNQHPVLKRKLFRIDYLTSLSHQAVITLVYHRQLDELWYDHAQRLREYLQQRGFDIGLVGRARKQKKIVQRDFLIETLSIQGRNYQLKQVEGSFTQPNAIINQQMIGWVKGKIGQQAHDLLELYCGSGNFTLPLADNFNQVLATEVNKTAVKAALDNIAANSTYNVKVARLSAQELVQALQGQRIFRRLADISLPDYNCKTLFVDPPRCGLDDDTIAFAQTFDTIIYISCNPTTLKANLEQFTKTHNIQDVALFDQFPYTHHIESGTILKKKHPSSPDSR